MFTLGWRDLFLQIVLSSNSHSMAEGDDILQPLTTTKTKQRSVPPERGQDWCVGPGPGPARDVPGGQEDGHRAPQDGMEQ